MKESSGSFQYESQRAGGKEKAEQRPRFRVSFLRVLRIFRTPILCHCPVYPLGLEVGGRREVRRWGYIPAPFPWRQPVSKSLSKTLVSLYSL